MATTTTFYGLYLPSVGDGAGNGQQWGTQVNNNFTVIDTTMAGLMTKVDEWIAHPVSLPAGGTTGQSLVKLSNTDLDVGWQTVSGGSGGMSRTDLILSPVDNATASGTSVNASESGSYTTGIEFTPIGSGLKCSGVRFYGVSWRSYKVSLWDSSGTRLATVTTGPIGSTGPYSASFSAPITLTSLMKYRVSMWEVSGATYVYSIPSVMPFLTPYYANPWVYVSRVSGYGSGDTAPAMFGGEAYICEPVLSL